MPLLYLVTKGKKSKTELKLCLFTPVEDKLSPVLNLLSTAETQVGALSGVYSPSSLFLLVVGPSNRRDMFGWCVCVCECVRVCVCVCVCGRVLFSFSTLVQTDISITILGKKRVTLFFWRLDGLGWCMVFVCAT